MKRKNNSKEMYDDFFRNGEAEKEYKRMYRRKAEKRMMYSDWKKGVIKYISKFQTIERLENFKYFCVKQSRIHNISFTHFPTLFLAVITLFLSPLLSFLGELYFSKIFEDGLYIIIALTPLITIPALIKLYKSCFLKIFYEDIVEIIEEYENTKFNNAKQ